MVSPCADSEPDWLALVASARAGEETAARALVEHLYPQVAGRISRLLPRRDEPADLVQDVFVKMFSRLEQFNGDAPFEHWVARLAHTTCLDALRRQRARPECRWSDLNDAEWALLESLAGETAPADADLGTAAALLEKLLAALPPEDAWLLRQIEIEERPLAGLCAERGRSAVTGRVRLYRARRRLTAAWKALEKTEP